MLTVKNLKQNGALINNGQTYSGVANKSYHFYRENLCLSIRTVIFNLNYDINLKISLIIKTFFKIFRDQNKKKIISVEAKFVTDRMKNFTTLLHCFYKFISISLYMP